MDSTYFEDLWDHYLSVITAHPEVVEWSTVNEYSALVANQGKEFYHPSTIEHFIRFVFIRSPEAVIAILTLL